VQFPDWARLAPGTPGEAVKPGPKEIIAYKETKIIFIDSKLSGVGWGLRRQQMARDRHERGRGSWPQE
jgi:hypothetical protein